MSYVSPVMTFAALFWSRWTLVFSVWLQLFQTREQ
jgi:hypothetical protein